MNEQRFGYRIKQQLNQGLRLREDTLQKLKAARELALERRQLSEPSVLFAWVQQVAGTSDGSRSFVPRRLLPALVLALGLFVAGYWYQAQRSEEIVEIDQAVLTGDLPIDAYLDKGFDAWLKRSWD
jgi:hypothetical protein